MSLKGSDEVDYSILALCACIACFITGLMFGNQKVDPVVPVEEEKPPVVELSAVEKCRKDRNCRFLAEMGYYEARSESDLGVIAVMSVVLNRIERKEYPNTVEGVIKQKCQFSYKCDGSEGRVRNDPKQWARMYELAYKTLESGAPEFMKSATHYHTHRVNPYWSKKFDLVTRVDNHLFYKCREKC